MAAVKALGVFVALVLLVACIPKYQPAVGTGEGYLEDEISPGVYRIHYQFNPERPYIGPTFEQLVLLRASDLTLEHGHSYFIVDKTALPGISRGGRTLIVKLLSERPDIEDLEVYDARWIASDLRARHSCLSASGPD